MFQCDLTYSLHFRNVTYFDYLKKEWMNRKFIEQIYHRNDHTNKNPIKKLITEQT